MSFHRRANVSRRALLQGLGGTLLPAFCNAAPAPGDWPCFRGPKHNGVLEERFTLGSGGPRKLWEATVGWGNASVAVVQDRLYTTSSAEESVICLNAATGRPIWKQKLANYYGHSTPTVEGDRLYGLSSAGNPQIPTAFCCNAVTGAFLWKRNLPVSTGDRQYGHAGSPLLWEDLVILNAAGGAALKKSTGEPVWVHQGFAGLATPVMFTWQGRQMVALFAGDRLIAREARSGREHWQIPWKTDLAVNACDPVIFENKIFLCSEYGRGRSLYDISGAGPRLLWEFGRGRGSAFSSGFHHEGQLYCFAEQSFCCLDQGTGQPKWRTEGGAAALMIGGTVILLRHTGDLRFGRLSAKGFEQTASANAGMRELKAVPAYRNGRLYLRNEPGQIACYQIGVSG